MYALVRAAAVVAGLVLCACDTAKPPTPSSTIKISSSETLFNFVQSLPPEVKSAAFAEIGNLTVAQYYQRLLAKASDQATIVDGVLTENNRKNLLASRDQFLALDAQFSNVAAVWQARGVSPSTQTYGDFAAEMSKALHPLANSAGGLGLYVVPQQLNQVTSGNEDYCQLFDNLLDQAFNAPTGDALVTDANRLRGYCANQTLTAGERSAILSTNIPDGQKGSSGVGSMLSMTNVCQESLTADATIVYQMATPGSEMPTTLSDHNDYRKYCMTTQSDGTPDAVASPDQKPYFSPDDISTRWY